MPLYEYECEKCSFRFERLERFSSDKKAECLQCQSTSHRVFSPPSVVYKASGFSSSDGRSMQSRMINDYKDGKYEKYNKPSRKTK